MPRMTQCEGKETESEVWTVVQANPKEKIAPAQGHEQSRGNEAARIDLGQELLDQGLDTAAVCRILGLTPEKFPRRPHR